MASKRDANRLLNQGIGIEGRTVKREEEKRAPCLLPVMCEGGESEHVENERHYCVAQKRKEKHALESENICFRFKRIEESVQRFTIDSFLTLTK